MTKTAEAPVWHYRKEGTTAGPFTFCQMKAAATNGELRPFHQIWANGMAVWLEAAKIRGLFDCPVPDAPVPGKAAVQPQYFISENGQRFGPVGLSQLRERVAAQQLRPEDLVWREGWPKWQAAQAVPDLFPLRQNSAVSRTVMPPPPVPPVPPAESFRSTQPEMTTAEQLPADQVQLKPSPSAITDALPAVPFGMIRLVCWSGLFGGWSALLGWAVAELLIGRWVGQHFLLAVLMVLFVASALGAGLSQVEALITSQWKTQRKQLLPGLLGGLAGGMFGGLLGNLLYLLMGGEIPWLGFLGRLLGWTLLGASIVSFEGLFRRHWRRFRNGLLGGSVGGFLGGLFFNPMSYVIGSPVSSRAFAFVLLGLNIGLFVGLVQVLLKEAWVTVQAGFRPGRQLILNDTITTMGTSESANLIFIAYGAQGVEPIHLKIRRDDDGSYILEDSGSRKGTYWNGERIHRPQRLADGDVIRFGINEIRFHERFRPRQAEPKLAGGGSC